MEVIMANTPNVPKSNKSTVTKTILAILAIQAIAAGLFYAGYNYKATQDAKTKAAVQDALKTVNAPAVAIEVPKN
jgi:hypothetical protein